LDFLALRAQLLRGHVDRRLGRGLDRRRHHLPHHSPHR
jgi:hypothetical protein